MQSDLFHKRAPSGKILGAEWNWLNIIINLSAKRNNFTSVHESIACKKWRNQSHIHVAFFPCSASGPRSKKKRLIHGNSVFTKNGNIFPNILNYAIFLAIHAFISLIKSR